MIPFLRRNLRRGVSWGFPLALSLLATLNVHGQTPSTAIEGKISRPPADHSPGFVLLRNGRVLVGAAQPMGSRYRILRGHGDEIWLPATQVEKTAPTIDELFRHQLDSAQSRGFGAWVEAADWLLDQVDTLALTTDDRLRFTQQANQHCQLASRYRPDHPSVTRLRRRLEQQERRSAMRSAPDRATTPAAKTQPATKRTETPPIQLATYATTDRSAPSRVSPRTQPAASPDPERLKLFAVKIQPTLINRCRSCHSTDSPVSAERHNAWLLDTPAGGRAMGREVSIANLKRTDAWIDRQADIQALAQYATTAHGGSRGEPISQRHRDARRWIEYFCQTYPRDASLTSAAPSDGHSDETAPNTSQPRSDSAPEMNIAREVPELASIRVESPPGSSVGQVSFNQPGHTSPAEKAAHPISRSHRSPRRLPVIANPHDPAIFHALPASVRSTSPPDRVNDPIGAREIP